MTDSAAKKGRIDCLVLKICELCNLNCSYCYMYQHADQTYRTRPRMMGEDVFNQLLLRVKEYCERRGEHRMILTLHGGEPTLMGVKRLGELVTRARAYLENHLMGISMQTNGTLIDSEWVEMIRHHEINVGISIDGPAEVHDKVRVDHAGRPSLASTLRGLKLLQDADIDVGALCVINPGVEGRRVYRYLRSLGIKRFNFLLPDVTHNTKADWYGQFGATPVADYLIPLFDEWFSEDEPTVHIRIFRTLISAMVAGAERALAKYDSFGNPHMGYVIVDTDGSIQALDVLKVCEEGLAESNLNVFQHGFDDLHLGLPLVHRLVHEGIPLCQTCQMCPERDICGGGYLPHRYSKENGFDNPSVWCQDIQILLKHIRTRVTGDRASKAIGNRA